MIGGRLFRVLLRLLPFDFRADYGRELQRTFSEQQRDARGIRGRARVWIDNVAAVMAIGPREHLAQLHQDIRYAGRTLRRNPAFFIVALLTLSLGTGANTAVFGIVHTVLLSPLPYADPDRLVSVMNRWDGQPRGGMSNPEYLDYFESSRTMDVAAMTPASASISGGAGDPERVTGAVVSTNVFDVLGRHPALGRGFTVDSATRADDVVVISDGLWRRRFAADPEILGRAINVSGAPSTVVGVLPPGFVLPIDIAGGTVPDVLTPLELDPAAPRVRRGGHYLAGVGRLRPGATIDEASSEMAAVIARLIRQYPDEHNQGNFGIRVVNLREDLFGSSRPVLWMLAGAVALVLLLACANVANLMMARGEARRRELSVRSALGASRFRMARQLITEALIVSVCAAVLGIAIAYWVNQLVVAAGPSVLPRLSEVSLNRSVILFSLILAIGTTILFGALPAWQLSRTHASDALKDGVRGGSSGARAHVRRALVICQVGVAVVLLVGAGLLAKSFLRLVNVPAGIDVRNTVTTRILAPESRYPGLGEVSGFYKRLLDRVRTLPRVELAGASSGLPLAVASGDWSFDIEGRPRVNGRKPGRADWYTVTPGYFETLQIPLVAGRLPAESDTDAAPHVIFLNESAARSLFPGVDPVGRRIQLSSTTGGPQPWRTIAGIVGDVRHRGLDEAVRAEMFIPYEQFRHFSTGVQARAMTLVVRSEAGLEQIAPALRAQLRQIDPEIPLSTPRLMSDVFSTSVADRRLHVLLIGAFALLAIALATIGIYGVIAYDVEQRVREIGIRVALGASPRSVLSQLVTRGLALVMVGAVIGLAAAASITGMFADLLFEVGPRDLMVFASVAALLAVAGAAASVLPARRALRVDPLVALRHD